MDAKEYIREKIRMFDSLRDNSIYRGKNSCGGVECDDCPMLGASRKCINAVEESVDIVEKWSKEHPIKTILADFLEKHPNAPLDNNGVPRLCPKHLGYEGEYADCHGLHCVECWNRPLEEVE